MSKAQVKREVNSIKQQLLPKQGIVDLGNLTEREDRIMKAAAEIIECARDEGRILEHSDRIEVTAADDDHAILEAAAVVLKRHTI